MSKEEYHIRDLHADDRLDYLRLLSELTDTSLLSEEKFSELYNAILNNKNHIIRVIEKDGTVIGCGTIIIEQKFTHGGSKVGHIEEIVILSGHRRQGLGTRIIKDLVEIGKKGKVYKIILDCTDEVIAFYESCNFKRTSIQMSLRF